MDSKKWATRITRRSDFTCGLVHLTKPNDDLKSLDVLVKILKEKTLIGNNGYVCGEEPVVCFQDVPLSSLSENILYEQQLAKEEGRTVPRYSACGLRFTKPYIYRAGGRPVIYEDTNTAKSFLPPTEYWRIVRFDLTDKNNFIDWTHEREWRLKGDLHFEWEDVEILLSQEYSLCDFIRLCDNNGMSDILNKVKGVITLKRILF